MNFLTSGHKTAPAQVQTPPPAPQELVFRRDVDDTFRGHAVLAVNTIERQNDMEQFLKEKHGYDPKVRAIPVAKLSRKYFTTQPEQSKNCIEDAPYKIKTAEGRRAFQEGLKAYPNLTPAQAEQLAYAMAEEADEKHYVPVEILDSDSEVASKKKKAKTGPSKAECKAVYDEMKTFQQAFVSKSEDCLDWARELKEMDPDATRLAAAKAAQIGKNMGIFGLVFYLKTVDGNPFQKLSEKDMQGFKEYKKYYGLPEENDWDGAEDACPFKLD